MTATFYLGTHMPNWLGTAGVPLFVSHRRLHDRRTLPRAIAPWALDSGGFTELVMYGEWRTTPRDYVNAVRRYRDEIGLMQWAAPQDWMCEPSMLAKTGLTVAQHQERTVANLLELRWLAPDLPIIPVVQGWTLDERMRHIDAYHAAGVNLATEPLVGLGSVCKLHKTALVVELARRCATAGIRCHAFGLKTDGWRQCRGWLASADSMAWSYAARMTPPMHGHTHKSCANCLPYALAWRERHVNTAWQPTLEAAA